MKWLLRNRFINIKGFPLLMPPSLLCSPLSIIFIIHTHLSKCISSQVIMLPSSKLSLYDAIFIPSFSDLFCCNSYLTTFLLLSNKILQQLILINQNSYQKLIFLKQTNAQHNSSCNVERQEKLCQTMI